MIAFDKQTAKENVLIKCMFVFLVKMCADSNWKICHYFYIS